MAAVCVFAAIAGCGGGGSQGQGPDGGGDGGPTPTPGGGAPVPDVLAGRWWGPAAFTTTTKADLAAFVPGEGVSHSLTGDEFSARVWTRMGGASDVVLSAATADSTWNVTGLVIDDGCGPRMTATQLVATPDHLEIQNADDGCGQPPGKVYATFHKSSARRVLAQSAGNLTLALSANSRFLAFVVGDSPTALKLYDQKAGTVTDVATGSTGGGLNPTPWYALFSADGSRLAYCKGPNTSGAAPFYGELHLLDIAAAHDITVAQNVDCGDGLVQLSQDGGRVMFATTDPTLPGNHSQVWELATAAAVTTQAPFGKLTPSGRYVIAHSGTPATFVSFDVNQSTSTTLGMAAYYQPTPDWKYLVLQRNDATTGLHVSIWDESTGTMSDLDSAASSAPPGPTTMAMAPFLIGPDGRRLLYYDSVQNLKLGTLGSTTMKTLVPSLSCNGTHAPAAPAFFNGDGTKIAYGAPTSCTSTANVLHSYDIAGASDSSYAPASAPMFCASCVSNSGAITYWAQDGTHVWSAAAGDLLVTSNCGVANAVIQPQVISDDGNRIYLKSNNDGIHPNAACLWDRTGNAITLIASASSVTFFDAHSATAVEYNGANQTLQIDRAGKGLRVLAAAVATNQLRFSPSGQTFALPANASDGGYFDVYDYALPSDSGGLVEGGDLIALGDSQVYFNGADGLCVADVP